MFITNKRVRLRRITLMSLPDAAEANHSAASLRIPIRIMYHCCLRLDLFLVSLSRWYLHHVRFRTRQQPTFHRQPLHIYPGQAS